MYDRLRGEPMEEFRLFAYQRKTLNFLYPQTDDGSQCLACPKVKKNTVSCNLNTQIDSHAF